MYDVKKTKRDAIEVSIEDKDPILAADMANEARERIDYHMQQVFKTSQLKMLTTFESHFKNKEKQIATIGDSLAKTMKKFGIYDLETQPEILSTLVAETESSLSMEQAKLSVLQASPGIDRDTIMMIKATVKGLKSKLTSLTSPESTSNFNLSRFNQGKATVEMLSDMYTKSIDQLNWDREHYKRLSASYDAQISAIHLIAPATVPQIKSKPRRSVIVMGTVVIAFLFCVLGVLLIDTYKDVNWNKIIQGND